MFKKILTAALMASTLAGASLGTTGTAEASNGRNGAFAAGAVLGLVGGSLLASNSYGYGYGGGYYAPVRYYNYGYHCWYKKRWVHDYYGWHKVIVKVCR